MARRKSWSPEEIEEMRQQAETMSHAEVGKLHGGITRERVRQLIGNANRRHPPGWKHPKTGVREVKKDLIAEMFRDGKDDEDIASAVRLSALTVRGYRNQIGLSRNLRHTVEHSLTCLHKWVDLFGYVPAATDWNPQNARSMGHERRAQRYEEFRLKFSTPHVADIQRLFGSWADFIEAGGYPRPKIGARRFPWREAPLLNELEEFKD